MGDYQVEWSKPSQRLKLMGKEVFDAFPDTLTMREVSLHLPQGMVGPVCQGFRVTFAAFATDDQTGCERVYTALLDETVKALLPYSPNRQDPRVVRQRPKPFPQM